MSKPTSTRPPQVTLAGTVVITASVLAVLSLWDRVAGLRSLESREGIERRLESRVVEGLGLDLEQALELIHVAALVAAGCATATAILGWFVLRRDKASRVALSVLAVPLFVCGSVVGEFWSSFVAAGAAMLWLSPAREWFATGSWTPPEPRRQKPRQSQPLDDPGRPDRWPPAPSSPDAGADPHHPAPPPQGKPYGSTIAPVHAQAPGQAHPWGPVREERPGSVVTASVIAIVASVLVGVMMVGVLAMVLLAPDVLRDEMARQPQLTADGTDFDELRPAVIFAGAFFLALCALALVFAGYLLAGREWARRGLMATAAFSAGLGLLSVVTAPAPLAALPVLLLAGAAVATLALLRRPESRAWCQRSGATPRR